MRCLELCGTAGDTISAGLVATCLRQVSIFPTE